jgi:hypothetical protein
LNTRSDWVTLSPCREKKSHFGDIRPEKSASVENGVPDRGLLDRTNVKRRRNRNRPTVGR